MKQKLFTLLLAVVAGIGTMFAWDYEHVKIGKLYYNLDTTNQIAEITSENDYPPLWSTKIITANIPATITYNSITYNVTSIDIRAFASCIYLTSVTIPNSVTNIGDDAFSGCSGLTSVTIPNSVTSMGGHAFSNCSGLTSVTIGNSVTSIGDYAFYNCSGLTSVTIPNNVTSIGNNAFQGCSGLTSVTIPGSVTSIGNSAFSGCSGLTSVTIPNSVTSIGNSAFLGCSGLTSPVFNARVFAMMPTSYSGAYTIPDGIESIAGGAFFNCTGLTSITIPNSVTSIGGNTFDGCSGLTSIEIPNSVTSIGIRAFQSCTGFTSVTIPNSVTSIGMETFKGCSGLTSVTIPNSVTSIAGSAFFGCRGLTSVTWNAKNCNGYNFGSQVTSFTFGEEVETIPSSVCSGMTNLTSITIPNSVTSIGSSAFSGCSGLTSVTIEAETPPTLGANAFNNTSNCPIYVPCGTLTAFQSSWSAYATRIAYHPLKQYTISAYAEYGEVSIVDSSRTICGQIIICTTIPIYGYHFTRWSDGNIDNPRTITLTSDTTLTAECAKNSYTISTTSANQEWGTTAGDKSALYLENVVISATANYGYHFVKWNDNNTENPRTISVTKDANYTATFAKNTYSITKIANSTQGSISGVSQAEYLDNVTLTVNPNYGYHFTHWSDGNTNNPRTFVLTQDTTFTAEFVKNTYTISTISANPEWGTTAGDTAALYLDEIEISAAPNYGYHFVKWDIEKYRELIDISSPYTVKFSVPNTWSDPYAWIWKTGGQGHWETLSYEKGMYVYRTEQNNMNIIVVPNGPSWGNGQTNDLAITESCCYTIRGFKVVKSYDLQIDTITTLETHNPLSIIVASNQNATAKFAKNTYSITTNAEHGTISGNSSAEYLDQVTLSVSSDYGYHFTQWSDGNTENPRTFVLTQDTTFTAEFAIDKSGTCGKNNLLQWTFADDGTLAISGSGELTENYTFGVEAPTQMQQLVVGNEVTAIGERAFYEKNTLQKLIIGSNVTSIGKYAFASINNRQLTSLVMPAELLTIGDYAFSGNTYLESIDFNAKLQSIGAYAFKDCYRVSEMTCLATVTPNVGTDALASINSYASLCVPAECLRKYQVDPNWGRFDLCELGTTSTVTENRTVTVEPTDNTAIFTWPTENNAASYSLQITKDGVVFCTLVFNSNGQLTGIAFAPGRNGAAHAPAATTSVAGMSFTVTGLDGASKYAYRLAVTNDASEELVAYSGEFATTGYDGEVNLGGNPEGIEDVFTDEHKASKILHDGQIFILRGDKVYTSTGQEVK